MIRACPPEFLALAARLADASGAVLRRHFRTPLAIDAKPDATPVTVADREAESAMRAILAEAVPDHGILGEEHGDIRPGAALVWVLDPIDGTKAYMTGKPMFGTLIALVERDGGRPLLGVIDQPVTRERWVGAAGRPTLFNGAPVVTRSGTALAAAMLNTTSPELFAGDDRDAFARLGRAVRHTLYGGDCYAYGLLAGGFLDLVVEAGLKSYDYCALVPVVEGAGGVISDWRGRPLGLDSDGRVLAAGDAALHEAALAILRSPGGA